MKRGLRSKMSSSLEKCDSDVSMHCRCRSKISVIAMLLSMATFVFFRNLSLMLELGAETQQFSADSPAQRSKTQGHPIQAHAASLATNVSAFCLLVKDDNAILPEFLAYHYHTLNLRNLIVAVDPLSSESPSDILQKWRLLTDLDVREWTDRSYMPASFLKTGMTPKKYIQQTKEFQNMTEEAVMEVSNHRYRQRVFLAQCMKSFRQAGLSWVVHIDTDEYIVASKLFRQMNPDYVEVPDPASPGSLLRFVQQVVQTTGDLVNYPCISMLRVLFGSVESTLEKRQADVPEEFNATAFESLRWRFHGLPHNKSLHGNPKVIVDVAAIPEKYFDEEVVFSIHRPIVKFCPRHNDLTFSAFRKQPVGVNHYLGSWERYSGRNDKRRSRAVYDAKASVNRGKDDGIRPWLRGFVEQGVGFSIASKLLGDAYLAKNATADAVEPHASAHGVTTIEKNPHTKTKTDDSPELVENDVTKSGDLGQQDKMTEQMPAEIELSTA